MANGKGMTRRRFLNRVTHGAAAAVAAPYVITSNALGANGRPPASERITMGFVGLGGQGSGLMGIFHGYADVEILGVCDVYEKHRLAAQQRVGGGCKAYHDFRELVTRPDIDAICVATPDHWHTLVSVTAMRNGKDIYCEKPLTLTIDEGKKMVETARRYGRVFQMGTQQRSDEHFRKACEWVRNGRIGKVELVRCWFGENSGGGWVPDSDPPEGLDWDFYLGPAPKVPFNKRRFLWDFRWFRDYSGGLMTDWGAHLIDIAQWGMGTDATGPRTIEATGSMPEDGIFEFPRTMFTRFEYDGWVLEWHQPGKPEWMAGRGYGTKFYGTEGEIHVDRGGYVVTPEGLELEEAGPGEIQLYRSPGHQRDFLNCVRSRRRPICDVAIGHRTTSVCHLSNIAFRMGRKLRWNPDNQEFVGDDTASRYLSKPYRAPWHL